MPRKTSVSTCVHRRRRLRLECLESRRVMAGLPYGAMPNDTAEFMLGKIVVTPVFIESDGSVDPKTQHWDQAEITSTLDKITTGVNWWSDTLDQLNSVHDLDFIIDDTYATNPYQSPYEPIDRPSDDYTVWIARFLDDIGYGSANSMENAVRQFNHAQRLRHNADWAYTMFVVDSSNDADGQFAPGTFTTAFALPGGLFLVSPSTRPASTFTHETGHIFYAMDEYAGGASYTAHRGYYDTPNTNAADNPSLGFVQQPSIMSGGLSLQNAYANHTSPASTLAMVGWQDSDNDGIFDVLDVPLNLTGSGRFDGSANTYRFVGDATVGTLANRNSTGLQNDITLNQISRIEYRLDGGDWQTIAQPQSAQASLDLSIPIDVPFTQIELRAIDQATGITSNLFTGTSQAIANADDRSQLAGFIWVDSDNNGLLDETDSGLAGFDVVLLDAQGQPLSLLGAVEPDDYPSGYLPDSNAVTISAVGQSIRDEVYSGNATGASTGSYVFQSYNNTQAKFSHAWSSGLDQVMEIAFSDPVSFVSIDATGLNTTSYGRIEAWDASGQLITRTSEPIALGEHRSLSLSVDAGEIAKVRVYGHDGTSIALDNLRFGHITDTQSDALGMFQLNAIPDGQYTLRVQADPHSLYTVENANQAIQIVGGTLSQAAQSVRVTSSATAWQNPLRPTDVNRSGSLTPLDALLVLNEINASGGSRTLTAADVGAYAYDVNGSGTITPIDALIVLNEIAIANLPIDGESNNVAWQTLSDPAALQPSDSDDEANQARDLLFALSIQDPDGIV